MPIKIPKNRKVVKSIKMKNSTLVGEVDDQGNMHWFKDGKYVTPYQSKKYRYYDTSINSNRKLGNKAKSQFYNNKVDFYDVYNPVDTPFYDKLNKSVDENYKRNKEKEIEQNIPLKNQKFLTLRTKGRMNLADVPINLLDSIAVNSGRSGTDFFTNAGLIGKESTFGGIAHTLGRDVKQLGIYDEGLNPHTLTNNHAYFITPEDDYMRAVYKKTYSDLFKKSEDTDKIAAENDVKYAYEHGLIKTRTPHYSDYILADAFKRYQVSPNTYNPGQKNYSSMVDNIKQELQGEKQLQEYWNSRGKQEYERGKKEGMKVGGRIHLDEVRVPYKNGGIYIKPSKRGTFTAAATKHGMGVQEFASKVLRNKENYSPSLVKKANFARNASKWH